MKRNLTQIEQELLKLIKSETHSWQRTAQLLIEVEINRLFEPEYSSLKQYVQHLAQKAGRHESSFWKALKAGKYYLKQIAQTDNTEKLMEVKVAVDTLETIEKIGRYAPPAVKQDILERVQQGNLSRAEAREAWYDLKTASCGEIKRSGGNTPHARNASIQRIKENVENSSEAQKGMTAIEIIRAIKQKKFYTQLSRNGSARFLTEFGVRTGSTRNARRIDLFMYYSPPVFRDKSPKINTVGIEIKVLKSDLMADYKTSEYMGFVDRLYVAVPDNLGQLAVDQFLEGIGVISVNFKNKKCSILREATFEIPDAYAKSQVMEKIILKEQFKD